MKQTTLTYKQKLNIMNRLGDLYRTSLRRIDIADSSSVISPQSVRDDYEMKNLMERTLMDCSADTQLITSRDFLQIPQKNWYACYFTRSQYYRKKKKAVDEFLQCLDEGSRPGM